MRLRTRRDEFLFDGQSDHEPGGQVGDRMDERIDEIGGHPPDLAVVESGEPFAIPGEMPQELAHASSGTAVANPVIETTAGSSSRVATRSVLIDLRGSANGRATRSDGKATSSCCRASPSRRSASDRANSEWYSTRAKPRGARRAQTARWATVSAIVPGPGVLDLLRATGYLPVFVCD